LLLPGASSGIGLVTARKAAALGARVLLASRSEPALSQIVEDLTQKGFAASYVVADVGKFEQVQQIAKAAENRFGGFDTWVNNAAVSIYGKLEDVSIDDHRRLFETNYFGVVHGSLVAAASLKNGPGAIINIGSVLCDRGRSPSRRLLCD
jgi:NAD(P)-dependent dehydrogenase (short-subunit alcohol dehydrogenase family)